MLSYLLASLAACANATSSVLQRKANRDVPTQRDLSVRLLAGLLHRPVWFAGIVAVIAGFLLQAVALAHGDLAVVQPVLVLELPATLLLASWVFRSHLHRREWVAAAAMTGGLAALLTLLSPSAGPSVTLPWYGWTVGLGVHTAVVVALAGWGRRGLARRPDARPAAVLGVAAGSAFGLTAALMKGATAAFDQGIGAVFTRWQLYAMVAAGAAAMFLVQSAMNAGRLIATQPGLTLTDPVVSILWGVLGFHEQVRAGWLIVPEVLSGGVLAGSVLVLARSPLLSTAGESGEDDEDEKDAAVERPAR